MDHPAGSWAAPAMKRHAQGLPPPARPRTGAAKRAAPASRRTTPVPPGRARRTSVCCRAGGHSFHPNGVPISEGNPPGILSATIPLSNRAGPSRPPGPGMPGTKNRDQEFSVAGHPHEHTRLPDTNALMVSNGVKRKLQQIRRRQRPMRIVLPNPDPPCSPSRLLVPSAVVGRRPRPADRFEPGELVETRPTASSAGVSRRPSPPSSRRPVRPSGALPKRLCARRGGPGWRILSAGPALWRGHPLTPRKRRRF